MSMDAITEKIAHFIGAFELVEQEARMRAEYDEFRAAKAAEADAEAIELRSLKVKETFKLKDVDAGVKVTPPIEAKQAPEFERVTPADEIVLANASFGPAPAPGQLQEPPAVGDISAPAATPIFILPPPSSMAQVTYQINFLSDNDSFGGVAAFDFQAVEGLIETLQQLYVAAAGLSPLTMDLLPTSADWSLVFSEIQDAAQMLVSGVDGFYSTSVMIGEDAIGYFADGEAIEEFVSFEELLPAYIAQERAEAEAAAEPHDPATDGHDFSQDFDKGESPFKVDDGHAVVAGANTLVNTASITSSWLDADVFVVEGDVIRMDAISQVNVVVDHDSISGMLLRANMADQASSASNAASIAVKTVAAARAEARAKAAEEAGEAPEDAPDDAADTAPILTNAPSNWTVVRYEGPVTQVNWVKQHTFTTDHDQAVVTFSGASTFLGLGENALNNSFDAMEYGYQYDLILVGGNLIDINMVNQLNIILDSDDIEMNAPAKAAASQTVAVADMPEQTGIAAGSPAAASGTSADVAPQENHLAAADLSEEGGTMHATDVTGSDIDGSSQQAAATSGLPEPLTDDSEDAGDAPQETADDEPGTEAEGPGSGPTEAISTGDNLAYNQASITTIGEDTDALITQAYSDALDGFAGGAGEITDDIANDDAFAGTALLRVLYIDGDFTTVNMVDQENILGDADQVHIARDDFAAALQDQIKITTGSNVAANIAAIQDNGLDSIVMAKGDIYSDALIHQANLMDTNVVDTGSSIADLANEAVAFLTDETNADTMSDDITTMTNGMIDDAFGHSDIMQTMLS